MRTTPPAPEEGASRGIYLGLGSNLGDRRAHLEAGLRLLAARGARPVSCSSIYLAEPAGAPPQGDFLNLVARVDTDLSPQRLLAVALEVEAIVGPRHRGPGGPHPRRLDVDLLLFGSRRLRTPRLSLPHPSLHLRRFVLVPLAELAPRLVVPGRGRSVEDLLASCRDPAAVVRYLPPPATPSRRGAP